MSLRGRSTKRSPEYRVLGPEGAAFSDIRLSTRYSVPSTRLSTRFGGDDRVISRRSFLMVTGAAAATAGALGAVPAAAQTVVAPTAPDPKLREPDLYQP